MMTHLCHIYITRSPTVLLITVNLSSCISRMNHRLKICHLTATGVKNMPQSCTTSLNRRYSHLWNNIIIVKTPSTFQHNITKRNTILKIKAYHRKFSKLKHLPHRQSTRVKVRLHLTYHIGNRY